MPRIACERAGAFIWNDLAAWRDSASSRNVGNRASGRTPSVKSDQGLNEGEGTRGENQTAFLTRPDRKQRVQTRIRNADPFTSAFTRCRLGLKTRLVLLFAWLTLLPV